MNTTRLGNEVMSFAYSMISRDHTGKPYPDGCIEKGENIIYCGKEPKTQLVLPGLTKAGGEKQKWCVAFVYYCYLKACQKLGIKNLIKQTAAVEDLYENSKGIFVIDDKPSPGAIAIRKTGITTNKTLANNQTISHALIVLEYFPEYNQMICVEGNSDNMVAINFYPRAGVIDEISDHKFIHAERTKGGEQIMANYMSFTPITAGKYVAYGDQDLASPLKEPQTVRRLNKREFK